MSIWTYNNNVWQIYQRIKWQPEEKHQFIVASFHLTLCGGTPIPNDILNCVAEKYLTFHLLAALAVASQLKFVMMMLHDVHFLMWSCGHVTAVLHQTKLNWCNMSNTNGARHFTQWRTWVYLYFTFSVWRNVTVSSTSFSPPHWRFSQAFVGTAQ